MTLRLQATEAQQNFGAMLDRAAGEDDVIVERAGAPQVVVVAYGRYQELVAAQRELQRLRLQGASAAAAARAAALRDEEIDALIEAARSEAHEAAEH
jgi:prevent-host-death family protein